MGKKDKQTTKPSIKGEIISILVCLPFLLLGIAFIMIGRNEIAYTKTCTEEIQGVITEVSKTHTLKNGYHSKRSQYKATYSYSFNDKELTDYFVTSTFVKKDQTIRIRYNPDNPKDKYIKGHDDTGNVFAIVWGIIWDGLFLLIVYCMLLSIIRKKFPNKDKS